MTSRRADQAMRVATVLFACALLAACQSDSNTGQQMVPAGQAAAPAIGTSGAGGGAPPAAGTAAAPQAGMGAGASGLTGNAGQGGSDAAGVGGGSNAGDGGAGGSGGDPGAGGTGAPEAGSSGASGAGGSAGAAPAVETMPMLYWLDINANRVMRSANFTSAEVLVMRTGTAPDGVAVDVAGGKIYWTNMGSLLGTGGGTLQRANLDGSGVETIIQRGLAQTPKQMQLDLVNKHIYFCDREGAKVWRANLDGSNPEAIVSGHGFRELVGVALDVAGGKFYFSDRIGRKILRANIAMPAGQTGANRTDIEEMMVFTSSAMPIDLDIDHDAKLLYWTDRDLGTVKRAGLDIPAGETASNRSDIETLVTGLVEPIGISLDVANNKMYFTELGGSVSSSALDGSGLMRRILRSGSATGVAIAHLPKP